MKKLVIAIALVAVTAPGHALAGDVDPARRDLFATIVRMNGCRMNNFHPNEALLLSLQKNAFDPDEVRAIGQQMMAQGVAIRQGDFLVLKGDGCP